MQLGIAEIYTENKKDHLSSKFFSIKRLRFIFNEWLKEVKRYKNEYREEKNTPGDKK